MSANERKTSLSGSKIPAEHVFVVNHASDTFYRDRRRRVAETRRDELT
jgi:hypothetical protein